MLRTQLLPLVAAMGLIPAHAMADTFSCDTQTLTPIYDIQGDGLKSPMVPDGQYTSNEAYYVRGVVTATTKSLYKGFFLQDAEGDGNPDTSDGIFVYTGNKVAADVEPGMTVCLKAKVKEHYDLTQLLAEQGNIVVEGQAAQPAPVAISLKAGEDLADAMERYEGMQVRLNADSALKVTRNFGFDYDSYRNNMVLSHGAPLVKPTQLHPAGSEAATALAAQNSRNQLFIDTDAKAPNGVIPYFPGLDAEQGYIRVGDTVVNLEGVIGYSYGEYRLLPTNTVSAADFIHADDRTAAPQDVPESQLKVASFNVLNFFTSDSDIGGALNAMCKDQADADSEKGCNRGAKTLDDFQLQRTKIVNALTAMNADIVGIMEMENNGFGSDSALANLVSTLNEQFTDPADHYSYITIQEADLNKGQFFGSDAIMVAMIYRPAKVEPAKAAEVIRMPEQHLAGTSPKGEEKQLDKYQRDSLMQAFVLKGIPGAKPLTVVVNHLKSKGSGCYEDWVSGEFDSDPADMQGHCNAFRVSAAMVLSDALKDVEGDLLVLGDMNAYAKEDPIRVLTDYDPAAAERKIMSASGTSVAGKVLHEQGVEAGKGAGLVNLATKGHDQLAYSYSYDGELGSLDHALASASLADKVAGIEEWHINSVESTLFEYSGKYSGNLAKSEGPYSASDHDPVVVSLRYPQPGNRGFQLTFKNKSFHPVYPVFNHWYWDSTQFWLMPGQQRRYREDNLFLNHVGIRAGDAVSLSVLAYGVFEIPCTYAPLRLTGRLKAVYNGESCRMKH
ncbi:ExeM/NucH family extracellular endonuclease [Photobacterium sp. CCB-ST2H9]|uniref:ExeM/NucH family extracellular endonuclease n=1 Tax=Photobacterium sp. CCB-ST2H9 TaxID=2912855 RepID=UPI00200552E2|nr:ExeM/NucH family extracellular endonuclease [Photobacterium sp. CCB-ST2H9]UTM57566.1 ExeM/NucH family extracellular endonuclease [Photobacterium sp. CCB-ST2H9]